MPIGSPDPELDWLKSACRHYPTARASKNPFNDFAPDLQGQTVNQDRQLTNSGARTNVTYSKGIHNIKVGATYEQTFLNESDGIGIVDPGLVAGLAPSCLDPSINQPIAGTPCAVLAPYDLTGGGGLYQAGELFSLRAIPM